MLFFLLILITLKITLHNFVIPVFRGFGVRLKDILFYPSVANLIIIITTYRVYQNIIINLDGNYTLFVQYVLICTKENQFKPCMGYKQNISLHLLSQYILGGHYCIFMSLSRIHKFFHLLQIYTKYYDFSTKNQISNFMNLVICSKRNGNDISSNFSSILFIS